MKGLTPLMTLVIASMIVLGALVVILGMNYNVDIAGNIDVSGQTQETVLVTYDGTVIEEALMVTTMDYATLNPGDDLSTTHTFANTGSRDYQLTLTTDLPANGDPADLWYGFDVGFLKHSDLTPITSVIDLDGGTSFETDYTYTVDPAFEDPIIPFPFHIYWDIDEVFWRILTLSSAGGGSVAVVPDQARYLNNTPLEITGTPDMDYSFEKWVVDGSDELANPYSFNILSDVIAVAHFLENPFASAFVGFAGFDDGASTAKIIGTDTTMRVYDSTDVLIDQVDYADGASAWSINDNGGAVVTWNSPTGIDVALVGGDTFGMRAFLRPSTDVAIDTAEAIVEMTIDSLAVSGVESGIMFNIDDDTHYNLFCTDSATGLCYVMSIDNGAVTVPHSSSGVTCTSSDILRLQKNSDGTYDGWFNGGLVFTAITVV